jgi:general secretion pathway protein G
MKMVLRNPSGISLIELVVTLVIISVLSALVLPSAQLASKRTKELELKRNLRVIRTALDEFYRTYEKGVADKKIIPSANKSGYPETLQTLVDGYDFGGVYSYKKKFLRKIPEDPFVKVDPEAKEEEKWGLRSYPDKPDSSIWGGEDVYDVYSLSVATAIDGTKYKDW